jgi:hypothetical protein
MHQCYSICTCNLEGGFHVFRNIPKRIFLNKTLSGKLFYRRVQISLVFDIAFVTASVIYTQSHSLQCEIHEQYFHIITENSKICTNAIAYVHVI